MLYLCSLLHNNGVECESTGSQYIAFECGMSAGHGNDSRVFVEEIFSAIASSAKNFKHTTFAKLSEHTHQVTKTPMSNT